MFTKKEKDLLSSIILGDGNIYKSKDYNSYTISCGHGANQKDYVEYKLLLLKQFLPKYFKNVFIEEKEILYNNKKFLQYRFRKSSKDFEELYEEYSDIKMFLSNIKSDRSVSIWFMDDGCVIKSWRRLNNGEKSYSRPSLKLCTHCFSLEENEIICEWFYKKYKIKPHILTEKKKGKTYYFIKFNVDETYEVYRKILKQYIDCCESMRIKFQWLTSYYCNV